MKRFKRIYVEITNICNMNCKFCVDTNRKKQSMSAENFSKIIDKIKGYTDYVYLHVKGEPLLNIELEEMLNILEKNNLMAVITTNGTLLEKKKDILKNSNCIYQINISMHSIEQNDLEEKNKKEYIEKIIDVANEISDRNKTYISYRFWNLRDINKIDKDRSILNQIARKYGIEKLENNINKKSFIKLDNNKFINLDTIFEWPSLNNEEISDTGSCYGLIDQIAILVDATVVPCCLDQNGDINLGNIFENTMEDILNSNEAKNIINGFKENRLTNELCKKCSFRISKRM